MDDRQKEINDIQQALDELNAVADQQQEDNAKALQEHLAQKTQEDPQDKGKKKTPVWGEFMLYMTQVSLICVSMFFAFAEVLGFWGWVLFLISGVALTCLVGYTVGGWDWEKDQKEYEEKEAKKKAEKAKNNKPYYNYWQLYYYKKTGNPKYLSQTWGAAFS